MPTTLSHLSTTRAPQPKTKLLVAGDSLTVQYKQWLTDFDLVDAGGNGEDPVQYPWRKRLLGQLNTAWVPRAIVLQDFAIPAFNPANITQQQYDDAWLALVNAAQTSSARVIVLVGEVNQTMLHNLPADEFLDTLPPDDPDGIHWLTATQKAQASIIANLIWSGA